MGRPASSRRLVMLSILLAAAAGVGAWILVGTFPGARGRDPVPEAGPGPEAAGNGAGPRVPDAPGMRTLPPGADGIGMGDPNDPVTTGSVPPGLRVPSGEDLSDPKVLEARLRQALGGEAPRWDLVADLLGKHPGPLPPDVRASLLAAFDGGRVAAAISAFARLRDPTLVPDLLRLFEDPATSPQARSTVMAALVSMPNVREPAVAGLARGLRGNPTDDREVLEAIARIGGPSAVRALVDALVGASDPEGFAPESWRPLSIRGSAESSQILAEALARPDLSPAARRAVIRLAGRPGASAEVVAALLALDGPDADLDARRAVYGSLAATGDAKGYERLLAVASDPAAPGAAAALHALGEATNASKEARERLLAAVKAVGDDAVRAQAVRALGTVKEQAAAPLLIELLAHPSRDVRRESVVALGAIGPGAAGAVEALGRTYGGGDPALRSRVATALAGIGGDGARHLLGQLRLAEKDEAVLRVVEEAYAKVGGAVGNR